MPELTDLADAQAAVRADDARVEQLAQGRSDGTPVGDLLAAWNRQTQRR